MHSDPAHLLTVEGSHRSLGFALGLVMMLAILAGGLRTSTTLWREAVLVVGAAALIPFVVQRLQWRTLGWVRLASMGIAWGLVAWSLLSTVIHADSVPWQQSAYGWYGRGTGVLTLAGCAVLLTAATVLAGTEILAPFHLLVVAAALSAVAAAVQAFAGAGSGDGLPGLMGNPDFNGALCGLGCGVAILLAVRGRWGPHWLMAVLGVMAAICAVGVVLSQAWQGLAVAGVTTVVGLGVVAVARRWWIVLATVVLILVAGLVSVALVLTGAIALPGAGIPARLVYWQTALNTMWHVPMLGVGPDAFAEAAAQYRSLDYLAVRSPAHHVSAAHSVPLQLGATLGIPALVMWCGLFGVTVFAIARAMMQRRFAAGMLAVVSGAWGAYVAQAFISLDQVALMAIGWSLTGLAIATACPTAERPRSSLAPWRFAAAVVAAAFAILVMAPEVIAVNRALSASTPVEERVALESTWTPCVLRARLAQTISSIDLVALAHARDVDPRCPGVGAAYAVAALNLDDPEEARAAAAAVIDSDPLDAGAWIILGIADARLGDISGAEAAQSEAGRITRGDHRPAYRSQLRFLAREIRAAESPR